MKQPKTQPAPTPQPLKDETLVKVFTPMGLYSGSFVWPTRDLSVLKETNNSRKGYHLFWGELNV